MGENLNIIILQFCKTLFSRFTI